MTKTTIALTIALIAGTASLAAAQDADPNLLNRYPQYNGAVTAQPQGFVSSQVRLQTQTNGAAQVVRNRPQAQTFQYDSAPLISGAGN